MTKEKEIIIELTNVMEDQATAERLKWLEDEQQKNDLQSSSKLGISILVGAAFWAAFWITLAWLTAGCMVVIQPTEYVDRELAYMSDGIHADDRIQLEKLINEK